MPADLRGQPYDQAHQRRDLHLQPEDGAAVPQDHPHQRVGGAEASRAAGQVEDGGRSKSVSGSRINLNIRMYIPIF